ncbi:hypothetical protein [uncultured Desulfuromusa sp.]|nr:hypothetical protein [uncultured Desulfuromusa sp.]
MDFSGGDDWDEGGAEKKDNAANGADIKNAWLTRRVIGKFM